MLFVSFVIPTFIVLMIGVLPSVVSLFTIPADQRIRVICIANLNLCGVTPYIYELWQSTDQMAKLSKMMVDPIAWIVMYGAASVGWLLYAIVPAAISSVSNTYLTRKTNRLRNKQSPLVAEFGDDVTKLAEKLTKDSKKTLKKMAEDQPGNRTPQSKKVS